MLTIKELTKIAFPDFKGRKIRRGADVPKFLDSYWDEGYRTYYCFVRLADRATTHVHSNHPGFEPGRPRVLKNELPQGWALVARSFAGEKEYVSVYQGTGTDEFPVLGV